MSSQDLTFAFIRGFETACLDKYATLQLQGNAGHAAQPQSTYPGNNTPSLTMTPGMPASTTPSFGTSGLTAAQPGKLNKPPVIPESGSPYNFNGGY